MGASLLAPPRELCNTPEERAAFDEARRSTSVGEFLDTHFSLRDADWGGLLSYLLQHREVVRVLLEAPAAIRQVFGEVRPVLDLVTDPEEGWEELFIVVLTRESAVQALDRLKRLDAEWFADSARRAHFAINVTLCQNV